MINSDCSLEELFDISPMRITLQQFEINTQEKNTRDNSKCFSIQNVVGKITTEKKITMRYQVTIPEP